MNKYKSLSDSSSSDSDEEKERQRFQSKPANYYSPLKTAKAGNNPIESNEDEKQDQCNSTISPFRSRNIKKARSSGNTEHEENEGPSSAKKFHQNNNKNTIKYCEKDSSSADSDEQSIARFGSAMPSKNVPVKDSPSAAFNDFAQKMMAKMGYIEGTGLGKFGQGRTEIVEASKQRGRRGFGLHLDGLEPSDASWDFQKEEVDVKEDIEWLPECLESPPSIVELREWMKEDKKNLSLDNETNFCDAEVLKNVLFCKSVFDELESEELRKARTRSNPFETIRGVIFQNRAAMKMANMDACFDFMFSKPVDESGESLVRPNELLYFADVCAGPGGFSEYILWRKKWECKGFGFTLKRSNDFKLDEFFSGPPETFETHYGVNGVNGDGDIYVPENLREFHRFVLASTENKGVHFVMADGGFSVEGQENIQEILSKRLYLCQFLCALLILRTGGHFVCKLFDIFTPFSVGLVYLMYRAFKRVCIHKPNTSRPANSERYIICKWRREGGKDICDYLFEVNCRLGQLSGVASEEDVSEVVSQSVLESDSKFMEYITDSNNKLGAKQIIHLAKIKAFAQNADLHEDRQSEFRKLCLEMWKIPDKARSAPCRVEPGVRYSELMQGTSRDFLNSTPTALNMETLHTLEIIFDFHFVVCGEVRTEQQVGLFLGLGRSNIYRLDMKSSKWSKIDATLELPADTLIYGELIPELKGEGKAQRKITCLHIIDALYLGGKDVRNLHFEDRMQLAKKLTKAVSKPSRSDYTPVRAKEVWQLKDIDAVLDRLAMKTVKGYGGIPRVCYEMEDGRHLLPSGLLIFKTVTEPWVTAFSKSQQRLYYFNVKNQKSSFSRVPECIANFKSCFTKRMLWSWERGVKLTAQQGGEVNNSKVHGHTIATFVQGRLIALRPTS